MFLNNGQANQKQVNIGSVILIELAFLVSASFSSAQVQVHSESKALSHE